MIAHCHRGGDKFRLAGKPITLIGLAFSTKKRAVSGAKIVPF